MARELEGQVAVVTGASRGIGLATAMELGSQGAYVVGSATTDRAVNELALLGAEAKIKGTALKLDLANPESFDTFMDQAASAAEAPVSVLVNNAGITRDQLAMRMTPEDWDEVITVNLNGTAKLTKLSLRGMMRAKYGRIINMTSVVGLKGNPGQTAYAASKGGIIAYTKALAKEVGSRGITVNAVAPGYVETDMTQGLPQEAKDMMIAHSITGRSVTPEEVAKAVAFLASPSSGSITGEILRVDGGLGI